MESDEEVVREERVPLSRRPEWSRHSSPTRRRSGSCRHDRLQTRLQRNHGLLPSFLSSRRALAPFVSLRKLSSSTRAATLCGISGVKYLRLDADLHEELDFVGHIAKSNSKIYQIWHPKQRVAGKMGIDAAIKELECH